MYIKKIQFENMLIVEVKNGNVEQALKKLKNKVRNVKQVKMLRDRQEFTKPSVSKRLQKQKAKYIQKLKEKEEK
jgi:small subunit ribosomal protein S21